MAIPVDDPKRWMKKLLGCGVGSVSSWALGIVVSGSAVAVGVPVIASTVTATVAASVIGASITKAFDNIMDVDSVQVHYHPHRGQEAFRQAIVGFLDVHLVSIIQSIQRNEARDEHAIIRPALIGDLSILGNALRSGTSLTVELHFVVRPCSGSQPRLLDEGRAPPPLPDHHENATGTYTLPRAEGILDGVGGKAATSLIFGGIGAAIVPFFAPLQVWHFIQTVPGFHLGLFYGMPTLTGFCGSATDLRTPPNNNMRTITSLVDFSAELGAHINRVIECAELNGVDLDFHVAAGLDRGTSTIVQGPNSAAHAQPQVDNGGNNIVKFRNIDTLWYERSSPRGFT